MKPEIINNFLDENTFKELKELIFSNTFPWYLQMGIAEKGENSNHFYFTHLLYDSEKDYDKSPYFERFEPIFKKLDMKKHIRSKLNCYIRTKELEKHSTHRDQNYSHKGFILPFNTNNGFTEFDDCMIKAVENRGYKFDPSLPHNSTSCTDAEVRMNININYI